VALGATGLQTIFLIRGLGLFLPVTVGIKRLLEWHDNIRHNPRAQLAQLSMVFGMDPRLPLVPPQDQQVQPQTPSPEPKLAELPKELAPLLEHLKPMIEGVNKPLAEQLRLMSDRLQQQELSFRDGAQRQTQEAVETWGEKKSYFNEIRPLMTEILVGASQIPGRVNQYLDAKGRVDLDKLYEAAL
jgi:hypothetical protein